MDSGRSTDRGAQGGAGWKERAEVLLSGICRPIGSLYRVRTEQSVAALTFDDGPDLQTTPALLEILERRGARATFFLIGEAAQRQPELVRRLLDEGHAIGNHSWDHPSLPLLGRAARWEQIVRCREALGPGGAPLLRPPYGHQSLASFRDARRAGYQVVAWSGAGEDWQGDGADEILNRLRRRLRPGAILLLHDSLIDATRPDDRDRGPTLEAVDRLLSEVAGSLRFVTVPELLAVGRPLYRPWFWRPDREHLARVRREDSR